VFTSKVLIQMCVMQVWPLGGLCWCFLFCVSVSKVKLPCSGHWSTRYQRYLLFISIVAASVIHWMFILCLLIESILLISVQVFRVVTF